MSVMRQPNVDKDHSKRKELTAISSCFESIRSFRQDLPKIRQKRSALLSEKSWPGGYIIRHTVETEGAASSTVC